jgi:hypothetical protein
MPSLNALQSVSHIGAKTPELPTNIEKPKLIEGETAIGSQSQNIEQFMAKYPNQINN